MVRVVPTNEKYVPKKKFKGVKNVIFLFLREKKRDNLWNKNHFLHMHAKCFFFIFVLKNTYLKKKKVSKVKTRNRIETIPKEPVGA